MNTLKNQTQTQKNRSIGLILLAGLFVVLLTGCGSNEQTTGNDASASLNAELGSFSESDIELNIEGKQYRCGEDASVLLSQLGDGYNYSEAISCAYDGLDKTYGYENFDIYTYPDGDIDRVSEITVYSGDVSTPKGLKIGDTVERMEELYGTGYTEEGITLIYEIPPKQERAEGASLYVTAEDGKIMSIAITAEMRME